MQLACTPRKFREGKAGEHTEVKRRGRLLSSLSLANNILVCPRYVDLTLNADPRMYVCVCVCVCASKSYIVATRTIAHNGGLRSISTVGVKSMLEFLERMMGHPHNVAIASSLCVCLFLCVCV